MTALELPTWLTVVRNESPLIVSLPHTGTEIPAEIMETLISPWLARKDTDWWVDRLYDFADQVGATVIRTAISRTVIDVNRDPSGVSLYPGLANTDLCPTTTFDGESLYRDRPPDEAEIAQRRIAYFDPYHRAIAGETTRLRKIHENVVLFDGHSIRSCIPRLFSGMLPHFNIGTNDGASCDGELTAEIEQVCASTPFDRVTNGRFKGGYIARHYGRPHDGIHAIQLELACRGYMHEPPGAVDAGNWPTPYDDTRAAPVKDALLRILQACLRFASTGSEERS